MSGQDGTGLCDGRLGATHIPTEFETVSKLITDQDVM